METLIYLAVWAVLIFLMMRFGCGAHVMGHGHTKGHEQNGSGKVTGSQFRWVPPSKDTDLVCGKTVATAKAKSSIHDGNVYYFCSRECREVFEVAPNLYVGGDRDHPKLEHSHA